MKHLRFELEKHLPELLLIIIFIILMVRFMFYLVHFFPGFGKFTWSRVEQKELYIERMLDELKKAKKKPGIYQSLKYYDIAACVVFAWYLYLTEKSMEVGLLKIAIGLTLLNYA